MKKIKIFNFDFENFESKIFALKISKPFQHCRMKIFKVWFLLWFFFYFTGERKKKEKFLVILFTEFTFLRTTELLRLERFFADLGQDLVK